MATKTMRLMADFETTTDPNDVRVWASCAVDIDKLEVVHLGTSIDSLYEFLQGKNTVVYYHNLKFDGSYHLDYLLSHGYKFRPGTDGNGKRVALNDKEFTCLITDDGLFYSIEVVFRRINAKKFEKVRFYDSLKKLPFKVAQIAKDFELAMSKGEIDYKAHRPIGYELTPEEKDYIIRDCQIVAEALNVQFEQGLTKMTNAGDAMGWYKELIGKGKFERLFPTLPIELDASIRRAYRGGFVYLKPEYKNTRGLCGKQYDVNSLYPWAMYNGLLPYGYPVFFEGKPHPDEMYPLFIVRFKCRFKLKEGFIPMLQLKKSGKFADTEYLTSSVVKIGKDIEDDPVEIVLTSVDLKLFQEHYDIEDMEWLDGYKFKGITGLFKEYIDHWMEIKETTTGAKRQLAKLQLNSLYGRFALSPKARQKLPYMDEKGVVRFASQLEKGHWIDKQGVLHDQPPTDETIYIGTRRKEVYRTPPVRDRDPVFTAMACFITAYARDKTIRSFQANYNRAIYADTDSLKLIGYEEPDNLDIHPTALGAWKDEGDFQDSKFIRAKTYMMTVDGKTKVTCAGMPENVKEQVTYENFEPGTTFYGKLAPRRYPGGIVLEETTFTIK